MLTRITKYAQVGEIIPFIEKTFHQTHRLGKIIYCYD
jgi:hypothetical protein